MGEISIGYGEQDKCFNGLLLWTTKRVWLYTDDTGIYKFQFAVEFNIHESN